MRINVTAIAIAAAAASLLLSCAPAQALFCGFLGAPSVTVSASPLQFGNYTPASTDTASTAINITCGILGLDILPSFTVSLSPGNAASAGARYMNKAGSHLAYNLYTDSGYGTVWGDGSGGSVSQSYNGSLLSLGAIAFTAWGRVPGGQYIASGAYSDRITVTVAY